VATKCAWTQAILRQLDGLMTFAKRCLRNLADCLGLRSKALYGKS